MPPENNPPVLEHDIEWSDSKVSRLWNYYARTPPYSGMYFSKLHGEELLRRSQLPLQDPLRVLDFGCGPGFIWDHLRRLKARWTYFGADFSPESVARLAARAHGSPGFEGCMHLHSLPSELASDSFDAVLLLEVVEHLDDRHLEQTLRETARVLKTGGVLVVSTPNDEDIAASRLFCPECGAIFHPWQHVRSWTVTRLAERLKGHGLLLRQAQTGDFSATGALQRMLRVARMLRHRRRVAPHMLAVFQKA